MGRLVATLESESHSAHSFRDFVTHDLHTQEECEAALSLAIRWSCTSVEQLALRRLDAFTERSHAERLALARRYNIQSWIRPALRALCLRPQRLTLEELRHLQPYLGDLELIIRAREESRNDVEREVDFALDAWERSSVTVIPEPNAGGTAFPPEGADTPLPVTTTATATQADLAAVSGSGSHEPLASEAATPRFDTTASNLAPEPNTPAAFVQEPAAPDDLDSDTSAALNATATETGVLGGSEAEAEDADAEGAGPIETGSESVASATVRNTSVAGNAGHDNDATVERALINFDTPAVQATGPGDAPELTTDFDGGQLADDVALSPIDDRFVSHVCYAWSSTTALSS